MDLALQRRESRDPAMIKVTQYEHHAEECCKMVWHTGNAEQKAQLEEMAQAWEALARDRAEQIKKVSSPRRHNSRTVASLRSPTNPAFL
jgi:hypothetical protein